MMTKKKHDYFGMSVYESDGGREYAVGTSAQATKAAAAYILDSLWAFNTNFIARFADLDDRGAAGVRKMQQDMSEDANPIIRKLVGEKNLTRFVREAIAADGRGHFLAGYDGKEISSNDIEGLPKGKVAFRIH
jgi:hypothetical protein